MLSNTLRLVFCCWKIIYILHPRYHPKIIRHILKNKQKNSCSCIHEIIQLITIKMKMKMKNKSHSYHINRSWSRHGHKYSKYKKFLIMLMLICINDTHKEKLCFTLFSRRMAARLLLTFFVCLHNQLSSTHSTITY